MGLQGAQVEAGQNLHAVFGVDADRSGEWRDGRITALVAEAVDAGVILAGHAEQEGAGLPMRLDAGEIAEAAVVAVATAAARAARAGLAGAGRERPGRPRRRAGADVLAEGEVLVDAAGVLTGREQHHGTHRAEARPGLGRDVPGGVRRAQREFDAIVAAGVAEERASIAQRVGEGIDRVEGALVRRVVLAGGDGAPVAAVEP